MAQFLIQKDKISNGCTILEGEEAHHAKDVFRLKEGDEIRLFDGEGHGWKGLIQVLHKSSIQIQGLSEYSDKNSTPTIILAQSLLPRDSMDWVVEKATELGVSEIQPLFTERCQIKLNEAKKELKAKHWQKTALSACKQSGRLTLPQVQEPIGFRELLDGLSCYTLVVAANPGKTAQDLKAALSESSNLKSILIVIGPEGGFSEGEIQALKDRGAKEVQFNSNILRSETASVYLLSVLLFHFSRS